MVIIKLTALPAINNHNRSRGPTSFISSIMIMLTPVIIVAKTQTIKYIITYSRGATVV